MARISVSKTTGESYLVLSGADFTMAEGKAMAETKAAYELWKDAEARLEALVREREELQGKAVSVFVKSGWGTVSIAKGNGKAKAQGKAQEASLVDFLASQESSGYRS